MNRESAVSPHRYVRRLAIEKATSVAERHPRAWVIAADTTVVLDGALLGKPRDERDARRMLRKLSARSHQVLSGIAMRRGDDARLASAVTQARRV